ncbi:unannotated protein [freshwater metagenome]|uniref:Unannotated protein n=1 Tax=freshwater metagenome TaxID=449393 RepID=A0A6J7IKV9_9ZZZZ|nr:hypothetical protein [Actinomycetota bacterium]
MRRDAVGRAVAVVRAEHDDPHGVVLGVACAAGALLVATVVAAIAGGVEAEPALRDLAAVTGLLLGAVVGVPIGAPGPAADASTALLAPRRATLVPRRAAVAGASAALLGLALAVVLGGVFVLVRAVAGPGVPDLGTVAGTWWLAPLAALVAAPLACGTAAALGRWPAAAVLAGLAAATWLGEELAGAAGGTSPASAVLGALGPGGPDGATPAVLVAVLLLLPGLLAVAAASLVLTRRTLTPGGPPT